MFSILVLGTTANFPDIMIESYAKNQYIGIYFIFIALISIYFLITLILAWLYYNYTNDINQNIKQIIKTRTECIRKSFDILTWNQTHICDKTERRHTDIYHLPPLYHIYFKKKRFSVFMYR